MLSFLTILLLSMRILLKNHDILNVHKAKIESLNEERTKCLEKIQFLESKHHYLLERNSVLTQEIENF